MGEFNSPLLAQQTRVETARPERTLGQRLAAAHRDVRGRSRGDSLLLGGRHQSLRRRLPDEHRLDPRGPAFARRVGQLRARHGEPESAGLRRDAGQRGDRHQWPAQLGRGLHAGGLSRHAHSTRAASRFQICNTPAGIDDAQQRGKLDFLNRAQSRATPQSRNANANSRRASPATNSPSACRPRRPKRSNFREETDATQRALRHGRQGDRGTFGRMCLLARRLVERGVRFVQLYSGAGSKWDAHARHREEPQRTLPRDGQADRRPAQGSEGARPARRHARRLGRRIRPHADERERRRPRSQSLPASRCGWPAAA